MQLLSLFFVTATVAFNLSPTTTAPTSKLHAVVDRRAALKIFTSSCTSIAFLSSASLLPANADGAVSAVTKQRASGIYGTRIAALAPKVAAGDYGAVVAEKNAFILFNSGAIKDKAKQSQAIAATNDIFAAVRSQDKKALQVAYTKYVKDFGATGLPPADPKTQGFGNDYDYKARTSAGTLYVR
ncbi:hypothetical protein ScalyP_jg9684 [Parmales sp. scaly parma]|nr:hypothetical protein ScalyP_jg9684 [Parmales sp. scaly parma]